MTDRTADDAQAAEERPDEESSAEPEETYGDQTAANGDAAGGAHEAAESSDESPTGGEDATAPASDAAEQQSSESEATDLSEDESREVLIAQVAAYDDALADQVRAELAGGERDSAEVDSAIASRDQRIEELEAQVEELQDKLTRKQADFQNFKMRQQKKAADQQARATEELLEKFLSVRDNLVRALEQDENTDIRGGVEGTLKEFDKVLEDRNVTAIEPEAGEETDPARHEVMMRVESNQPEGTVVDVFRPGFEIGDRIVRTAQVTVSGGSGE